MDFILGTAGHIDHGKTTLVNALTGINCDRLSEEQRRGITIELGFAWLDLPDGRRLGIVDVPGHERFVKNMVAGASGIDCVLMIIAADEGVMPQTREHLEICSLLGVKSGLVALTKTDLVDQEWLQIVQEDIQNNLEGTFLEHAPIIPVSAVTGAGLERLKNEIVKLVSTLKPSPKSDIFRLPVDRVFTMKGFGTVVTGTIVSGTCALGEKLCILPANRQTRARSLQVHNKEVETAHTGQRCAINLQGLEVDELQRGDVVAKPDTLFPSNSWIIQLSCLDSAPLPIRQRSEVHFHHGSRECQAKIILLDRDSLEPGQTTLASVKFESPLPAVFGDHVVLRSHSPLRAIGGGVVASPLPPELIKRHKADYSRKLALLSNLGKIAANIQELKNQKTREDLICSCLRLLPPPGCDLNQLQVLTGLPQNQLLPGLEALENARKVIVWDQGRIISADVMRECLDKCRLNAEELHKQDPLKGSFPPNTLLSCLGENLPQKFTEKLVALAIEENILSQAGTGLKLADHKINFSDAESALIETILKKIKNGGNMPPFIRELLEEFGWDPRTVQPLLNHLCESGALIKIQEGVYYDAKEFNRLVDKIRAWFETHAELEIGNIKEILGITRKYAVPVLEYLDATRITSRIGNKRILRKN